MQIKVITYRAPDGGFNIELDYDPCHIILEITNLCDDDNPEVASIALSDDECKTLIKLLEATLHLHKSCKLAEEAMITSLS